MLISSTDEFQAITNPNLNKIYTYIAKKTKEEVEKSQNWAQRSLQVTRLHHVTKKTSFSKYPYPKMA